MSNGLRILLVLLLVLGNGWFVVAEYALITARRARLAELAKKHRRGAATALRLMEEPVRFISTVQIGITIFSILLGAIGEPLVSHFLDPHLPRTASFLLSFAILTYLGLVVGELVPKAVALQHAERIAVVIATPVDIMQRLVHPLVLILQGSAKGILRLLGMRSAPVGLVVRSEEEIRSMLAEAEETGLIEEAEEEMLYKVFDFADKEVHDVMVPRPEVVGVSVELPAEECLAAVIDSPYTRYPAYRGSLDEIAGILHVRDLFSALYANGIQNVHVEDILRPAYFVPETKDLGPLLTEFRRTNQHIAIVVDEYGSTQGIVTLEDLLEEIVGEIEDEYDMPDDSVQRIDEHTIRVDGTFPIDDFNERFGQELPVEDYHTLAGFVFGELGRAPAPGDEVLWDGLRFQVVGTDGPRIEVLEVEFLPHEEAEETEREVS
ncbi:MAG: hemolysin family protein [Thermoleophilia bacterium]|nr:hemolysin family protein [Thermoleophilia bacterium]